MHVWWTPASTGGRVWSTVAVSSASVCPATEGTSVRLVSYVKKKKITIRNVKGTVRPYDSEL